MFGSDSAILVRDERHKEKVLAAVGNGALVLTVHEAKGLEFQVRLLRAVCGASSATCRPMTAASALWQMLMFSYHMLDCLVLAYSGTFAYSGTQVPTQHVQCIGTCHHKDILAHLQCCRLCTVRHEPAYVVSLPLCSLLQCTWAEAANYSHVLHCPEKARQHLKLLCCANHGVSHQLPGAEQCCSMLKSSCFV
jgi:hypothetical protein